MISLEVRGARDTIAWARIDSDAVDGELHLALGVAAGQLPHDARRRLVEQAFAQAVEAGAKRIHVTVPVGESELIALVRHHCANVRARAAGASCLIDADLTRPEPDSGRYEPVSAPPVPTR